MNRVVPAGLIAIALLVGYLIRAPRVDAQTSSFPYGVGDSVRLEYSDGGAKQLCVIERFYGSFVSCKTPPNMFAPPGAPPAFVYNLNAAMSVHLVKRAE